MNARALGLLALKVGAVSAFAGLTAYANEVNVSDSYRVVMSDINSTLTLTPTNSANWRTVVGDPVFWFDASERDGWVLDGSDIVKIPSKVGERYLTSDWTEQGTSFTGWGSGKNICPPQLVTDDKLGNGGWVVEFGALGSMRALLFNAVARSSDGAVKSYLENIGSVVAVYNSANSGGYFLLGGGRFTGRDYIRAGDQDGGSAINYWNGLLAWVNQDHGDLLRQNFFMDDLYGITDQSGFGGNWQVIAYSPKSATAGANGLGLGRAESGYASTSGGMGIAEILIFDRVLTKDELYLVDAHLQEKWFRKGPRGWGPRVTVEHLRNSRSTTGAEDPVRTTVAVGADQALEIGKLNGGRNGTLSLKAKLIKTGEGTVTVRDGRTFGGDIELKGGTLAFEPKRKVPASADELPYGLYVRFDPSESACLVNTETVNGTNFIGALRNLTTHRRAKEEIFARPYNLTAGAVASTRAWLLPDDLGAGLNVVDFGLRTGNVSTKGCMYAFATNATAGARVALPQVTTLIAVVGAQRHGGSIMDSLFKRNTVWAGTTGNGDYSSQILHKADGVGNSYKAASVYAFRDGVIWIDGEKRANTSGYPSPGYHVLALQVPAHTASFIGGNQESCYGGLRLGEMLVYNRPLKDEELRDAQAYLMRKWLGRTPGGYEDAASKAADIQSVAVRSSSGAAIDVPEDETASIETLNAPGVLAKTGEGTLEVGAGSDLSGLKLVAGDVKVRTDVPDVTAKCEIASGASLHLDATAAATIDLYPGSWQNDEGGVAEKRIHNWRSVGNGVGVFQASTTMSEHPTLMENELNGLPVVDFGPYAKQDAGAAYLTLVDPLDNVRSVFAVVGSQNGGGSLLGNSGAANRGSTDFSRASSGVVLAPETPYFDNAKPQTKNGEIWIDGVQTDFTAAPNGGYELLELHTADGGHVSALGNDCDYYHRGGLRIGEIVIYERVLSEREKVATRNYLLKKWFARDESDLADLPAKPTIDTTVRLGEISVAAGDARAVEADMSVLRLTGAGEVAKTGAATTLSVKDLSDFGGVLSVAAGTVALTGAPTTDEPELVTDGLIAHFDAAKGVTLSENNDGTLSVASWRSQVGDWIAEPGVCYGGSVVKPNYLESELNGLPVVKLQYDGWKNNAHMEFKKNGELATLTGIRSVFWLVGSQEGGGYLLGGGLKSDGITHFSAWLRGDQHAYPTGSTASDGLTHWKNADAPVINASWRLNGAPTVRSAGLTGGYDVLSMVVRDDDAATTADGFAFPAEFLSDQVNYCYHCGRQRLGEVLVYDRSLSSDEVAKVEAYLKAKWGYTQKSATNGTTVELAADATLATTGSQYVDTLSGEGDVSGDVTVRNFIADAESDGFSVSGTLTVAANPTVTFTNLPDEIGAQLTVPLATAAEYAGTENLGDATFVGVPDTYRARLRIRNGKLVASLRAPGTLLILR